MNEANRGRGMPCLVQILDEPKPRKGTLLGFVKQGEYSEFDKLAIVHLTGYPRYRLTEVRASHITVIGRANKKRFAKEIGTDDPRA